MPLYRPNQAFEHVAIDEHQEVSISLKELGRINGKIGELQKEIDNLKVSLWLYRSILLCQAEIDWSVFESRIKPEDIHIMRNTEESQEYVYLRIPVDPDMHIGPQDQAP